MIRISETAADFQTKFPCNTLLVILYGNYKLDPCLPVMGAPKAVERTRETLLPHTNSVARLQHLGSHPILGPDDTSKWVSVP